MKEGRKEGRKEGMNERESNANANRTRNPKPDFSAEIILRYLFLDFHLYRSTAVLHAHASLTKRTPENSFANTFSDFAIERKGNPRNPARKSDAFSDFVFDRKIRNPDFNTGSKSAFPNRTQP